MLPLGFLEGFMTLKILISKKDLQKYLKVSNPALGGTPLCVILLHNHPKPVKHAKHPTINLAEVFSSNKLKILRHENPIKKPTACPSVEFIRIFIWSSSYHNFAFFISPARSDMYPKVFFNSKIRNS